MKILGLEISRAKKALSSPSNSWPGSSWPGSIFGLVSEPYPGAWQQGVRLDNQSSLLQNSAIYACVTGISTDVAKMRIKLLRKDGKIWSEESTVNSPFLPVLRRPNHYQNRIKFVEQWILSKLLHGNAYVLKQRDQRGIVTAMYVLHPLCVKPLVAESGDVYYELRTDHLSRLDEDTVTVPAAEMIHDMMVSLWHPLIGVSPLYACTVTGTMANKILADSTNFFGNRSMPAGVLTAPGEISDATATRLTDGWQENYGGANVGKVAILGDGLKFEAIRMAAEQSQLVEQLGWTVDDVARAFHYPIHKLGGTAPAYAGSVDAANLGYYTDCLQQLIESFELSLDEGIGLPQDLKTEFDLDGLLRMDQNAIYETNEKGVKSGTLSPDDARRRLNLPPVPGGASPYLQQQNYSLEALAKRDAQDDPFAAPKAPAAAPEEDKPEDTPQYMAAAFSHEDIQGLFELDFRRELIGA